MTQPEPTRHQPVVRAKEFHVNAFPNPQSPNARCYLIRVIRFDDQPDEPSWGVFDLAGLGGARLGPDGNWSTPPEDDDEHQQWRADRRYSQERALELACAAAPLMTTGPDLQPMTIDDMLAWEKDTQRRGTPR